MQPSDDSIIHAAGCLAAALEDDPFYQAITVDFADHATHRRAVLATYFEYSFREGLEHGFTTLPDDASGAAIWAKPLHPALQAQVQAAKHEFLAHTLGAVGLNNYHRIIEFMTPHTAAYSVNWYLSILGICPDKQGSGLGAALLRHVLSAADSGVIPCYVETFNPRTLNFYRRMGFLSEQSHLDPVTGQLYWILLRQPG